MVSQARALGIVDYAYMPAVACRIARRMKYLIFLLAAIAAADVEPIGGNRVNWVAVPECSSLVFHATQQGARFEGRFARFEARVTLDEAGERPAEVQATIDLASVDTQDEERDEVVVDVDFFNTTMYPRSVFKTQLIDARGDGYRAIADLTIRDQGRPVVFDFTLTLPADGPTGADARARLQGRSTLKRLEFGVGQGDWADTEWLGDEVEVTVVLCLKMGPAPEPES